MDRRVVLVVLLVACAPRGVSDPAMDYRAAMATQVRFETQFAWNSYVKYAWGHDELKPISHTAHDWYGESLLITPVDALDTLIMLGLTDEANAARRLIDERLSFDKNIVVKNFEITIRVLGGLLSGYQLTGDAHLLALADDLGARLLPVFDSPTGMPYMFVNLRTHQVSGATTNPAEIGTLLLEFGALAKLTGKPVYYEKAKRAVVALFARRSKLDLVGDTIDVETGTWKTVTSHVGGGIDSYYEYLLKSAILFDDPECMQMWRTSQAALQRVEDQAPSGLWYGEVDMASGQRTGQQYEALAAFLPAVLVLAGDLDRARRLEASSFQMWQLRGLEPEVLDYGTMVIAYPGYPLRPEIIESAWYLRRATGDPQYLAMGQTFLAGLISHARTADSYTVVTSVDTMAKGDLMPSYFLAESLKYLYLIFAPDSTVAPGVVFTTEAHPLRRTW